MTFLEDWFKNRKEKALRSLKKFGLTEENYDMKKNPDCLHCKNLDKYDIEEIIERLFARFRLHDKPIAILAICDNNHCSIGEIEQFYHIIHMISDLYPHSIDFCIKNSIEDGVAKCKSFPTYFTHVLLAGTELAEIDNQFFFDQIKKYSLPIFVIPLGLYEPHAGFDFANSLLEL